MISPRPGVFFSLADAGDLRHDMGARRDLSRRLGLTPDWATLDQVHGATVVEAKIGGDWGKADAAFTLQRGLPLAVFTADCVGVVLVAEGAVGVAHAGWRGAAAGVVSNLVAAMTERGQPPVFAALGPSIGPCCYEVGPEVASVFPGFEARTIGGAGSVDLRRAVAAQLPRIEAFQSDLCTFHGDLTFSHRRDGTGQRMVTLAWRP